MFKDLWFLLTFFETVTLAININTAFLFNYCFQRIKYMTKKWLCIAGLERLLQNLVSYMSRSVLSSVLLKLNLLTLHLPAFSVVSVWFPGFSPCFGADLSSSSPSVPIINSGLVYRRLSSRLSVGSFKKITTSRNEFNLSKYMRPYPAA